MKKKMSPTGPLFLFAALTMFGSPGACLLNQSATLAQSIGRVLFGSILGLISVVLFILAIVLERYS